MKNFYKKLICLTLSLLLFSVFVSCYKLNNKKTIQDDYVSNTEFAIKPANDFAMKKSNEKPTVEETKAHHIYQDVALPVSKEIVIGEKQFLTKINKIKNNIELYKNSMIVVEGMYGEYQSWDGTFSFPMVYRNGPACCGDDQYGGFFLVNMDNYQLQIDDWIVVSGVPFMYEHTDSENETQNYLFLLVNEIQSMPTKNRGYEMVND